MKILIDANIIYSSSLIQDNLPAALESFFKVCAEKKHEILITLTTKLEFDRNQKEVRNLKIRELNNATRLLHYHKIGFNSFNPEKLIYEPDIIALIKTLKVTVNLVEPDINDFKYAHEKACLHLAPHPPDIKSDEMRDLIVWSIALKTAEQNGGAMLISSDQLHVHMRGDEEASMVGLVRLNNLESALEYMEVETPNGKIISVLLDKAWSKLIENGIPLKDKPTLKGISNVRFIHGKFGPTDVSFRMKVTALEEKELISDVAIKIDDNLMKSITLDNTLYGDKKIQNTHIEFEIEVDLFDNDYEQRLNSLKTLLKSNK